jgi:LAO/AO transport system kinase
LATDRADELSAGVLAREFRAIARALSAAADGVPEGARIAAVIRTHLGRARVVGITGPPGAGKSTLVDRLVGEFRRLHQSVGVIAVDPSSPFSGGALLGDRVRMQAHATDGGVFIRSLATRGGTGGLARGTAEAVAILDAAGFDVVLVETVGVGQDEIDIARLADVRIVVLVPEAGDDVQSLKAGIMEIADIFVINKSDREGADRSAAAIERAVALGAAPADGWVPPVVRTVATDGTGVDTLLNALHRFWTEAEARVGTRRQQRLAASARTAAHGPGQVAAAIDHVGVAVGDPAPLLSFLQVAFGAAAEPAIDLPSHGVRVRFVRFPQGAIEVIEPEDTSSPVSAFLDRRGPGLHHVAVSVRDLDGVLLSLKDRGVRLLDETPRPGAEGLRVAFVHPSSAGGVLVELIEEKPSRALR